MSEVSGLVANMEKSQVITGGVEEQIKNLILKSTGFQGVLPLKCLGVPIATGRMSKVECRGLVDKIASRIKVWASRHISFARRTMLLINAVLMGILGFWASIFVLPKGVIKQVTALCRNYLWGADHEYKKTP